MRKWAAVILLAVANFIMVLDGTVMNVSISTVVQELHTDIAWMQMAITCYTLTMASFMLIGGKLGGILGSKRAFLLGCVIYGLGALITGLSLNIFVLMLGWSVIEGLGAALVIPSLSALAATNYHGRDRVAAYAILGAVAGVAAAAGPLIGGFITTYFSWRYVFFAEVIIMALALSCKGLISDSGERASGGIDIPSALLSVVGFILFVFGLLQSKVWGWITPEGVPQIAGVDIAPFGISLVAYLLVAGFFLLALFYARQWELERKGKAPLLKVSLLKRTQLRSGLAVLSAQYIIIASIFFVIPIYLQMVLGYDALSTGIEILPLSLALIVFSMFGARLSAVWSPRRIVRCGQIALVFGAFALIASVSVDLRNIFFLIGMAFVGAGLGMLASQLGNINMSAVEEKDSIEVGSMQGVAQNIGSSLGTALVGSFLVLSLTTAFLGGVQTSSLPSNVKEYIQQHTTSVEIVSAPEVNAYVQSRGLSAAEAQTITEEYVSSQIAAIKKALFAVAVLAIFSLFVSRYIPLTRGELPSKEGEEPSEDMAVPAGR